MQINFNNLSLAIKMFMFFLILRIVSLHVFHILFYQLFK